jgi:hypothetical protein
MFIRQNIQFSPLRGSIHHDFKMTISHLFWTFSAFCQGEMLYFRSSFNWISVEKQSIWKVNSWIWPLSPDFWPFDSEPAVKPTVTLVNHSGILVMLSVIIVANCSINFRTLKWKWDIWNLDRLGHLASKWGKPTWLQWVLFLMIFILTF